MEISKDSSQPTVVQRTIALGLAVTTTAFIAASVVTVVTGNAQQVGGTLVRTVAAPIRALLGG